MAVDPLIVALFAAGDSPTPVTLQYGIVTSNGGAPLFVQVGAGTVGLACPRLASYTPGFGHFVAVLVVGADRLCLGNIV